MSRKIQTLVKGDEKKHSVVYNATDALKDNPIRNVYVMRTGLPSPVPAEITMTLEWKD